MNVEFQSTSTFRRAHVRSLCGSLVLVAGSLILSACSSDTSVDLSQSSDLEALTTPGPSSSESDPLPDPSTSPLSGSVAEPNRLADTCTDLETVLDDWTEGEEMLKTVTQLKDSSKDAGKAAAAGKTRKPYEMILEYREQGSTLRLELPQPTGESPNSFESLLDGCEEGPTRQRALWAKSFVDQVNQIGELLRTEEIYEFPYSPPPGAPTGIRVYSIANFLEAYRNGVAKEVGFTKTLRSDFEEITSAFQYAEKMGTSVFESDSK